MNETRPYEMEENIIEMQLIVQLWTLENGGIDGSANMKRSKPFHLIDDDN